MLKKSNQSQATDKGIDDQSTDIKKGNKQINIIEKLKKRFNSNKKEEELKPANKASTFATKLMLLNPLGTYKKGYNISVEKNSEEDENINYITVEEKKFSKRLQFILLIMALQSIPLSFTMTASISIPWTFNVVIPFSLDFLPFDMKEVIESLILMIQNVLKPLDPLINLIEQLIKFFSTLNPAIFFSGTFWLFDYLGWIDINNYDLSIPDDYNNGSKTSMDIFAYHLEKKFPSLGGGLVVPFLLVLFSIMGFFFLITKGRKLLFEILSNKAIEKNKKKMRKKLLPYYMTEYNTTNLEMNYVERRSSRKRSIKSFFYSCIVFGIFVSLTPMYFALYLIFFP